MALSETQRDFLTTLDEMQDGQLFLYEISARMTKRLSQSTIDSLIRGGLLENGDGRKYRITNNGREALTQ